MTVSDKQDGYERENRVRLVAIQERHERLMQDPQHVPDRNVPTFSVLDVGVIFNVLATVTRERDEATKLLSHKNMLCGESNAQSK